MAGILNFEGIDPLLKLSSKLGVALDSAQDLHPVFRIAGIVSQTGTLLDYAVKLVPDRPETKTTVVQNYRNVHTFTAQQPTIVMVGCGGTGSHLLPNILQYAITKAAQQTVTPPCVIIIDGDGVEEKNLIRQRFTQADLGENKAIALSRRYSAVFATKIKAVDTYLEDSKQLIGLIKDEAPAVGPIILVGAVDNHRARAILWDTFLSETQREIWWVDAGNESWHGQVISGCRNVQTKGDSHWAAAGIGDDIASVDLPCFFDEYPKEFMKIGGTPTTPQNTCAAVAEEDPQTIHANSLSAQCASNIITQILEGEVRVMGLNFDAKTGQVKAKILTRVNIATAYVDMKNSRTSLRGFLGDLCSWKGKSEPATLFPGLYKKAKVEDLYTAI